MKKFLLGFATGLVIMHLYLSRSEQVASDAVEWAEGAASNYRHDKMHEAIDGIQK